MVRRVTFIPASVKDPLARALYRIVMGQVRSYIHDHPDHVKDYAKRSMPISIAKRVVGDLMSEATTEHLRGVVEAKYGSASASTPAGAATPDEDIPPPR